MSASTSHDDRHGFVIALRHCLGVCLSDDEWVAAVDLPRQYLEDLLQRPAAVTDASKGVDTGSTIVEGAVVGDGAVLSAPVAGEASHGHDVGGHLDVTVLDAAVVGEPKQRCERGDGGAEGGDALAEGPSADGGPGSASGCGDSAGDGGGGAGTACKVEVSVCSVDAAVTSATVGDVAAGAPTSVADSGVEKFPTGWRVVPLSAESLRLYPYPPPRVGMTGTPWYCLLADRLVVWEDTREPPVDLLPMEGYMESVNGRSAPWDTRLVISCGVAILWCLCHHKRHGACEHENCS